MARSISGKCRHKRLVRRRASAGLVPHEMGDAMSRIFLSHSSADNAEAIAFRDWLRTQGWGDVFLDLDPRAGLKPASAGRMPCSVRPSRCEIGDLPGLEGVGLPRSGAARNSFWPIACNKRLFALTVEPTPFALCRRIDRGLAGGRSFRRDARSLVRASLPPGDKTATVAFSGARGSIACGSG